jgi:hypothetical protein
MSTDPSKEINPVIHDEHVEDDDDHGKLDAVPPAEHIKAHNEELYLEALEKYGAEGSIDPQAEKRLKR